MRTNNMFHNKWRNIFITCTFGLLFFNSATQAERLRVGMLCPAPEDDSAFWGPVVNVMRAAAQDLDIELIVKCSRRGTLATKRAGITLLNFDPPLDYLISGYWKLVTIHHLRMANEKNIKTIIINSRIDPEEKAVIGNPRRKLHNWIGHLVPDDKQAAIDLTKTLVDAATLSNGSSKRTNIIALVRNRAAEYDRDREAGVLMQAQASPGVRLTVFSLNENDENHWGGLWALGGIGGILQQHSSVNVIWGIGDAATRVALRSAEKVGRKPGKDIFIGGFDWKPETLKATEDGKLSASMLGHFLEGVWALIMAHDHHYGFDFKEDVGVLIKTPLVAMTPENVAQFKDLLGKEFWHTVDYRKLSKKYNPALKSYNFNINQFLGLTKTTGSHP